MFDWWSVAIGGAVVWALKTINFTDLTAPLFDRILPEPWNAFDKVCRDSVEKRDNAEMSFRTVHAYWTRPGRHTGLRSFELGGDLEFIWWREVGLTDPTLRNNPYWEGVRPRLALVPKGTMWDGASSPTNRQRGLTASILHDYQYKRGLLERADVDKQFACDLRFHDRQPLLRVWAWYFGVRLFGGGHWGKRR